ncbi:Global transcription regulator sge1 [Coemansia sp. RSA 1694]|nr:Global transcription regulator sge1 [Coemansia sp. RSA 1694]
MSINVSEPSTGSNDDSGGGLRPTIDPCAVLSTLDTSPGEVVIGGSSACLTVTGLKVTSTRDAMMIFEACRQGILPRVVRRLHDTEKKQIDAGTIVVFDEREAKMKRWTDGRLWTPSRIVNNFLLYRELQEKIQPRQEGAAKVNRWTRNTRSRRPGSYGSSKGVFVPKEHGLIKRTISLSVPDNEAEYLQSQGPWRAPSRVHQQHLISYSYAEGEAQLPAPDDMEELQYLRLPLQLLRIQKFRRPVHITFVDEPSNYDMVETDEEDGDETTAANTGNNNAQRTTTGSGHSRRVYGTVADTLSPLSSELSASLPLSSPIHQPQIDPLGMEPPTTVSHSALASCLHLSPPPPPSLIEPGLGFNPDLYSAHMSMTNHPVFMSQPTSTSSRMPYYDFTPTGNAVHDVMFGAIGEPQQQQLQAIDGSQPATDAGGVMYSHHATALPSSEYMGALYGLQQQQFSTQPHVRVFYEEEREPLPLPMELSHPTSSSALRRYTNNQ